MNKQMLLSWLIQDAEANEKHFIRKTGIWADTDRILMEDLAALNAGQAVALPDELPSNSDRLVEALRRLLDDKVTLVSRVLSEYCPNEYFFYNVSKLENEIFDGLAFFSDLVPEFRLPFDRVGKKGMQRYLVLNQALLNFTRRIWPRQKNIQPRLMYFLYKGLGELFQNREELRRYWVVATGPENFAALDTPGRNTWSGRKEMRTGDLIFAYRMAPRKAMTDIFRGVSDAYFDPYWSWQGFKVDMERICAIPEIPFGTMRLDPVLKEWGVIARQFQGVIAEPVPYRAYNRLLDYLPKDLAAQHGFTPETVAAASASGMFGSEAEFDEQWVLPLLRKLGLKAEYQYSCPFHVGSQVIRGRVDFLVSDERGPLTLFEDKVRIRTDRPDDLEAAALQARSYALLLGLPSFVVAAPEGLWLYRLKNHQHQLDKYFSPEAIPAAFEDVRTTLERMRN